MQWRISLAVTKLCLMVWPEFVFGSLAQYMVYKLSNRGTWTVNPAQLICMRKMLMLFQYTQTTGTLEIVKWSRNDKTGFFQNFR